jgi:A/G-specific adenine glycosylase
LISKFPNTAQKRLLRWFDKTRRDLPWRIDRDPYRIWISEAMLQQTQVATVIPYFERFLKRFPSLLVLAEAVEAEVLKCWEGLGYYRRARHLHAAAKKLQSHLESSNSTSLPDDPELWESLPGIGRYMLGAILSQAFDRRLPILEANTKRVLARLFTVPGELGDKSVQDQLWQHAEAILPKTRVGDFNQALMELGALVCTVQQPKCNECPLAKECLAFQSGKTTAFPEVSKKSTVTKVTELAVAIRKKEQFLLLQRSNAGRWASMWELPRFELTHPNQREKLVQERLNLLGYQVQLLDEFGTLEHAVTRFKIRLIGIEANYRAGELVSGEYIASAWVDAANWTQYPMSVPQRKLINQFLADRSKGLFDTD